ncbi:hypothetical protein [Ilyobacter polytropus]|uniref:Transcriptional regulator HTH-type FeoC domain-containing protein n=1 Tax=Ilyobacter polytropus (strain ATCC 51220 / DSM 2926 / LMG 16218 / CuHBu1) TaxID=572544 RepID=E3HAQ3_ILYPC|nr:hypothetical protein [Ilyobacter polytropus]ADO82054.1 hypothetical protein Ilyop_0265 [Ilyobacter polytropus DSM 2926]
MENKEIDLLKLLLSGEVFSEDEIMENMNINTKELENLFDILEDEGYLEVDNGYFEKTCDNCSKGGNCTSPTYKPSDKVKKIRVITWKAIEEYGQHP